MFSEMNLRWRLLASYLVKLLIIIAIVSLTYLKLDSAAKQTQRLNETAPISPYSSTLGSSIIKMQRASYAYLLLNGNHDVAQDYPLVVYQKSRSKAHEMLDKLGALEVGTEIRGHLDTMREILKSVEQANGQLMALVDAGKQKEALELMLQGRTITDARAVDDLTDKITEVDSSNRMAERKLVTDTIGSAQHWLLNGLIFISVFMVGFSIWLSIALSRRIIQDATQIASAASQIASTLTQHEQTVSQQSASVVETTGTVEEIVASARLTSSQAEASATAAKSTQETTNQAMQIAARNLEEMAELDRRMSSIAERIVELSGQAAQIGNISRLVGELAGETNMLALNAAVEAARAGEHGKGFSVVASEIRKLADQSKQSAERANQIVAEIQKSTNAMVMTAEEGGKTSREVADSVREAAAAFETVNKLAVDVYQSAHQVLLNSKQQATALAQIDEAMKTIRSGAQEITAGTVQARAGVRNLSEVADHLKRLV